ncbi:E3 SUMO-protein ligase NSE2-like [Drosophila innubila]|uniref:E3 SUMO-protein ligase NSE2-like n=1 Tax=Drosophila innubila TaxID=198719 RepID=UPI00148C8128|nr:E3 SUMO-protein ligase NSE2-like [Drosophila innubila]
MNFINDIDNMKKCIVENTEYMKSFEGTGDTLRDELKKFNDEILEKRLAMGETLIRLKTKQKRLDQILEMAGNDSDTLQQFEKKYADLNASEAQKRSNIKLTSEYKEFKDELVGNVNASTAIGSNGNMEAEIMEIVETGDTACSMYDPWTKGLMLNPMRNIKCGHHYDRDSVMSVIKNNMSVRCPVVGCATKSYIQPNHLQADLTLQQKINDHKAEQEASLSSEDDED